MTTCPASVEWTGDRYDILPDSEHGAPLLRGGRRIAGYRDARFLKRPDAHTVKQWHVAVVSHEYAVDGGTAEITAACDPRRRQTQIGISRPRSVLSGTKQRPVGGSRFRSGGPRWCAGQPSPCLDGIEGDLSGRGVAMFTELIRMCCSRRRERRCGVRPSGMRRLAVGSAIVVLLLPSAVPGPAAAAAPLVEFAYVTLKSGFVAVIDTKTNTVIATIPVGNSPSDVAITPDGRHGYIVNTGSNTVSVINNVRATIPVGDSPSGVAINPDGSRAYVTNAQSNTVSVIDTGSNTVIATISGVQWPQHVAISPDGGRAYITGSGIDVFDTATNTPIDRRGMFLDQLLDVAITPDGSRVYISVPDAKYVLALDAATNSTIAEIPGDDWPGGVAITPDSSRVYVTNTHDPGGGGEEGGTPEPGPGTVQVIDTATNTVTATITVEEPLDVAITPDGGRAYVTDLSSKSVVVIDTATNSITGTIPLGANPTSVAIGHYR